MNQTDSRYIIHMPTQLVQQLNQFNSSYIGCREDIVEAVPKRVKNILDVGCSVGSTGEKIRKTLGARVVGIELDKEMADVAERVLDRVIVGDVEAMAFQEVLKGESFDCIIFADILEHLRDPWTVLKNLTRFLQEDGTVILSIPNVGHFTTILSLIMGRWPLRERGIHDRTHLRFFTLSGIRDLVNQAGLDIMKLRTHYRVIEAPNRLNNYAKFIALPGIRRFLAFQYLVIAVRKRVVDSHTIT